MSLGGHRLALFLSMTGAAACATPPREPRIEPRSDEALARDLGKELLRACPVVAASDEAAREACAQRLDAIPELREHMAEPFLWGGQATPTAPFEEGAKTSFNPLAWRKMYLSLEMFSGEPRVETRVEAGRTRIYLHLASRFRGALEPGEYPYPFWHSKPKWDSYQQSTEVIFLVEDGTVQGALRSAIKDKARPATARAFDGNWVWKDAAGKEQPEAAIYARLFSPDNPHVAELDRAYRAFEAEARPYNCTTCHKPDNPARQRPLEILLYPNHALTARHEIARSIAEKQMPPPADGRAAAGIMDDAQRERLVQLARAFEQAADAALASETARRQPAAIR
jgi:hypothetical protein